MYEKNTMIMLLPKTDVNLMITILLSMKIKKEIFNQLI